MKLIKLNLLINKNLFEIKIVLLILGIINQMKIDKIININPLNLFSFERRMGDHNWRTHNVFLTRNYSKTTSIFIVIFEFRVQSTLRETLPYSDNFPKISICWAV